MKCYNLEVLLGNFFLPFLFLGNITDIVFEANFSETEGFQYEKNPSFINGLPNYFLEINEEVSISSSQLINIRKQGDTSVIEFRTFTPGSVVVVK